MAEDFTQRLEALYASRGYQKVAPARFEPYEERTPDRILPGAGVLTFTAPDGRVMALSPDITFSIAKAAPPHPAAAGRKLYYSGEVFRLSAREARICEIRQTGIEIISPRDALSDLELVDLALCSLELAGEEYALDISHAGLLSPLLDICGFSPDTRRRALDLIRLKSARSLAPLLEGAPEVAARTLIRLVAGPCALSDALCTLRDTGIEPPGELKEVASMLAATNRETRVGLDLSATGSPGYYSGLVLAGYINGLPDAVLTGGRYDGLMKRLGKDCCAAGFAVSTAAFERLFETPLECDILVVYPEECDRVKLLCYAKKLMRGGRSVRLDRAVPEGCRCGRVVCYEESEDEIC